MQPTMDWKRVGPLLHKLTVPEGTVRVRKVNFQAGTWKAYLNDEWIRRADGSLVTGTTLNYVKIGAEEYLRDRRRTAKVVSGEPASSAHAAGGDRTD